MGRQGACSPVPGVFVSLASSPARTLLEALWIKSQIELEQDIRYDPAPLFSAADALSLSSPHQQHAHGAGNDANTFTVAYLHFFLAAAGKGKDDKAHRKVTQQITVAQVKLFWARMKTMVCATWQPVESLFRARWAWGLPETYPSASQTRSCELLEEI